MSEETIEYGKNAGYSHFEAILGENDFLTGAHLTWIDFLVYSLLIDLELHPKYEEENERLSKWYTRIQALPFFHLVHRGKMRLLLCEHHFQPCFTEHEELLILKILIFRLLLC